MNVPTLALLLAGLVCSCNAVALTPAAENDLVTDLPGANFTMNYRTFAGYLTVDPAVNRSIFYMFFESESGHAESDPVIWWSNGGPGCSGLLGALTEQGPFKPTEGGKGLVPNQYGWNKLANTLFVEAPAGVGYSFSDRHSDYTVGDNRTAQDNYLSLVAFFKKFPHLAPNDFYITSESYGGHYIPTLTRAIIEGNRRGDHPYINFKGLAVGNPYTDPVSNNLYGALPTFWGHSLISRPTWLAVQKYCIDDKNDRLCDEYQNEANKEIGDLDPYGLDWPICTEGQHQTLRLLQYTAPKAFQARLRGYDPCRGSYASDYLNREDVRTALHVNPELGKWSSCSDIVNYSQEDTNAPMEPVWKWIVANAPRLNMLVYSGDDDSVCASLGTQYWIYQLGLPVKKSWHQWSHLQQPAGFNVQFDAGDGAVIHFTTVHGAGHQVPQYKPQLALSMLSQFLEGTL